jgi:hypothetical protein
MIANPPTSQICKTKNTGGDALIKFNGELLTNCTATKVKNQSLLVHSNFTLKTYIYIYVVNYACLE